MTPEQQQWVEEQVVEVASHLPTHPDLRRTIRTLVWNAIARGAAERREACAVLVENLSQYKVPDAFRNCDLIRGETEDGWAPLDRQVLLSIARAIRTQEPCP